MESDPLETRLAALQRQNQWLKGASLLLSGVVLGMLIHAGLTPTPTVLPPAPSAHPAGFPRQAMAPPPVVPSGQPSAKSAGPARTELTVVLTPARNNLAIALDGHLAGYTDKGRLRVPVTPGHHQVALVSAGYVRDRTAFEVHQEDIGIRLKALELAHLQLDCTPRNARWTLDGPVQVSGRAPVTFNSLHPGRYRVEVSRPGYHSTVLLVRLTPGGHLIEHATLLKQAPLAYVPPRTMLESPRPLVHHRHRRHLGGFGEMSPHHYTNRAPVLEPAPRATPLDGEPLDVQAPTPEVPGPEATHE